MLFFSQLLLVLSRRLMDLTLVSLSEGGVAASSLLPECADEDLPTATTVECVVDDGGEGRATLPVLPCAQVTN